MWLQNSFDLNQTKQPPPLCKLTLICGGTSASTRMSLDHVSDPTDKCLWPSRYKHLDLGSLTHSFDNIRHFQLNRSPAVLCKDVSGKWRDFKISSCFSLAYSHYSVRDRTDVFQNFNKWLFSELETKPGKVYLLCRCSCFWLQPN